MSSRVQRFKGADGREGSYAPMGNGLVKVLFDDGSMVILRETASESGPETASQTVISDVPDGDSGEAPPHA